MTKPMFRLHADDPFIDEIHSPLYRHLAREWVDLNGSRVVTAKIRRWAHIEPALANVTRVGDVVDRIDQGDTETKDACLLALIRLYQDGHELAGRIALQAMLPKLSSLKSTARQTATEAMWREDRRAMIVGEFWAVLTSYDTRNCTKVAANLALSSLRGVTRANDTDPRDLLIDPVEIDVHSTTLELVTTPDPVADQVTDLFDDESEAATILKWALQRDIITATEARAMHAAYVSPTGRACDFEEAARIFDTTPVNARQRCSRTSRRLAEAVRLELTSA